MGQETPHRSALLWVLVVLVAIALLPLLDEVAVNLTTRIRYLLALMSRKDA